LTYGGKNDWRGIGVLLKWEFSERRVIEDRSFSAEYVLMKKVFFGILFLSLPLWAMHRHSSDVPSDSMVRSAAQRFASVGAARNSRQGAPKLGFQEQEAIQTVLREIPIRDLDSVVSWTLKLLERAYPPNKMAVLGFVKGIASEDRDSAMSGLMSFLEPKLQQLSCAEDILREVLEVPHSEREGLWEWRGKLLKLFGDRCCYGVQSIRSLRSIPVPERESILAMAHEFFGKREGGYYSGDLNSFIKPVWGIPFPVRISTGMRMRHPFFQTLRSEDKLELLPSLSTLEIREWEKLLQRLEFSMKNAYSLSVKSLIGALRGSGEFLDDERFGYALSLFSTVTLGESRVQILEDLRSFTPAQQEDFFRYRETLRLLSPQVRCKEALVYVSSLPASSREGLNDFCSSFLDGQQVTKDVFGILAAIPISQRQELIVQKESLVEYAKSKDIFLGKERDLRAFLTLSSAERARLIPFLGLFLGVIKEHHDIEECIETLKKIPEEEFQDIFLLMRNMLENAQEKDLDQRGVFTILEDFLKIHPQERVSVAKNFKRLGLEGRPKDVALIPCDERDDIVDALFYLKEKIRNPYSDLMSQIQKMVIKDFPHTERYNFCKAFVSLINLFKIGTSDLDSLVSTAFHLSPDLRERFVASVQSFFSRSDYQESHERFVELFNGIFKTSPTTSGRSLGVASLGFDLDEPTVAMPASGGVLDTLDGIKEVWNILVKEKQRRGNGSRYDGYRSGTRLAQRILMDKLWETEGSSQKIIADFLQIPLENMEDIRDQEETQGLVVLLDTLSASSRENIQRHIKRLIKSKGIHLTKGKGRFGLKTIGSLIETLRLIPAKDRDEVVSYSLPLMTKAVYKQDKKSLDRGMAARPDMRKKDQRPLVLEMVAKMGYEDRKELLRHVTRLVSPAMDLGAIENLLKMVKRLEADKRQSVVVTTKKLLNTLGNPSLPSLGKVVDGIGKLSPEELQDLTIDGVSHVMAWLTPELIKGQGEEIFDLLKSIIQVRREERGEVVKWAFRLMPPKPLDPKKNRFSQLHYFESPYFSSSYRPLIEKINSLVPLERDEILEGVAQLCHLTKEHENSQHVVDMIEKIQKIDPPERKEVINLSSRLISPWMDTSERFQIIDQVLGYSSKEEPRTSRDDEFSGYHYHTFETQKEEPPVKFSHQDRRRFVECVEKLLTPNMKFHEVRELLKAVERVDPKDWERLVHLTHRFVKEVIAGSRHEENDDLEDDECDHTVDRSHCAPRDALEVIQEIRRIKPSEWEEVLELSSRLITPQMDRSGRLHIIGTIIGYGPKEEPSTPPDPYAFRTFSGNFERNWEEKKVKAPPPDRRHFVECVERLLTPNMGFWHISNLLRAFEGLERHEREDLVSLTLQFVVTPIMSGSVDVDPMEPSLFDPRRVVEGMEKIRRIKPSEWQEVVSYSLPLMTEVVCKKEQQSSILEMVAAIRSGERKEVFGYVNQLIAPAMDETQIHSLLRTIDRVQTSKREVVVAATKELLSVLDNPPLLPAWSIVQGLGELTPGEIQELMLDAVPRVVGKIAPELIKKKPKEICDLLKAILKVRKEQRGDVVGWAFRLLTPEMALKNIDFSLGHSFSSFYSNIIAKIDSFRPLERDEILEAARKLHHYAIYPTSDAYVAIIDKIKNIKPSERKEVGDLTARLLTFHMTIPEILRILDRVMQYGLKEETPRASYSSFRTFRAETKIRLSPPDLRLFIECVEKLLNPNMGFSEVQEILGIIEKIDSSKWANFVDYMLPFLKSVTPGLEYGPRVDRPGFIEIFKKIQKVLPANRKKLKELAQLSSRVMTPQMDNYDRAQIIDTIIGYGRKEGDPKPTPILSLEDRRYFVDRVERLLTPNMSFQEVQRILNTVSGMEVEKLDRHEWEDLVDSTLQFVTAAMSRTNQERDEILEDVGQMRHFVRPCHDPLDVGGVLRKIQRVEPSQRQEVVELSSRLITSQMGNNDILQILDRIIAYGRKEEGPRHPSAISQPQVKVFPSDRCHFVDCVGRLITPNMRYQDVLGILDTIARLDLNEREELVRFTLQFVTEVMSGSNYERGHLLGCFQSMGPEGRQDILHLMGQLVTATMSHHDRFQILERLLRVRVGARMALVHRVTERLSEDVIHHGMLEGDRFQRITQLLADPEAPFQRRVIEVTGEEALMRMQGELENAFHALVNDPQASAFVKQCLPKDHRCFPEQCAAFMRNLELALRGEKSGSIKFRIQKASQGLRRLADNIREDFRIRQMPSIRRLFGLVYTMLNYGFTPDSFVKTWLSEKSAADSDFLPNFKAAFFHRFPSLMSFDTLGIMLEEDEARGGELSDILTSLIKDPIYLQFREHVIVKELTKDYIRSFMARNVPLVEALMMSMRGHNRNILDAREQDSPACVDGVYTGLLLALREVKETGDIVAPLLSGIEMLKCS